MKGSMLIRQSRGIRELVAIVPGSRKPHTSLGQVLAAFVLFALFIGCLLVAYAASVPLE